MVGVAVAATLGALLLTAWIVSAPNVTLAAVGGTLIVGIAVVSAFGSVKLAARHRRALFKAHTPPAALWVGEVRITEGQRAIAGNQKVAESLPTGWLVLDERDPLEFFPTLKSHKRGYTHRGFHWHKTVQVTRDPKGATWTVDTPDGTFTARISEETEPLENVLAKQERKQ